MFHLLQQLRPVLSNINSYDKHTVIIKDEVTR